ncbi:MAG TPA: DUF2207 domain-containing protein, partial [Actinomycetales bacterium]|nr:DUF2207 domain-containing protein [Actinomycetales bacterium]
MEREGGERTEIAVGAPDGSDDTRSGVQVYVLSYRLEGALNAIRGQGDVPDQDELYWNIFTDFEVPVEQVSARARFPNSVPGAVPGLPTAPARAAPRAAPGSPAAVAAAAGAVAAVEGAAGA